MRDCEHNDHGTEAAGLQASSRTLLVHHPCRLKAKTNVQPTTSGLQNGLEFHVLAINVEQLEKSAMALSRPA
jgi:hypothetical protein